MEAYDLRQLPEEGAEIDEALELEWLARELAGLGPAPDITMSARSPGRAVLEITPLSPVTTGTPPVRVHGTVRVTLLTQCVRCLADIDVPIEGDVDLTLYPREESDAAKAPAERQRRGKKTPKVEISRQALDEGVYDEHMLDLPGIVREAILLELEMNPSCADEEGCTKRTEEMVGKADPTRGEPEPIDPRWAALLELRQKSS